jgi:hypothetical protein
MLKKLYNGRIKRKPNELNVIIRRIKNIIVLNRDEWLRTISKKENEVNTNAKRIRQN